MLPLVLDRGSWSGSFENRIRQWGVGHGGFFTQNVVFSAYNQQTVRQKEASGSLNIVFDCGAGRRRAPRSTLRQAISKYLDYLDGASIDLLAISHFDMDHVNGLDHLSRSIQKRGIRVERAWAPMLTPIERLELAAEVDHGECLRETRTLRQIVADPESTLGELFPGAQIRLVESADGPTPPTTGLPVNESFPPREEGSETIVIDDYGTEKLIIGAPYQHTGEALWELCPIVTAATRTASRQLNEVVTTLIGKRVDDCKVADLMLIINSKPLLTKFYEALKAERESQGMPTTRGRGGGTLPNLTSLCLYSGPTDPYSWCRNRSAHWFKQSATGRHRGPSYRPWAIPVAPSWLGTGDAVLSTGREVKEFVASLGSARMDRIGIASAPHHGSKLDSCADLWTSLQNLAVVTLEGDHPQGGTGNKHPHSSVLADLRNLRIVSHVATADCNFDWIDRRYR